MTDIMDPAFRDKESCNNLQIGINRDRGFQEMFSDLASSFGEVMTAIAAGETG